MYTHIPLSLYIYIYIYVYTYIHMFHGYDFYTFTNNFGDAHTPSIEGVLEYGVRAPVFCGNLREQTAENGFPRIPTGISSNYYDYD